MAPNCAMLGFGVDAKVILRRSFGALLLLLAACHGAPQRPACPAGEVCIEYGNYTEPATLDPAKSNLVDEQTIISDLMMGLTTDAPDGSPMPGLAQRWDTSADGLTWTFHLRPSRWSDGAPVTAGDFVFGLRRLLDPKTAASYAYLAYVLSGAEAVNKGKATPATLGAEALDDRTLRLTLSHPAPYLPELLKHPSFFAAPEHVVRLYGDDWVKPGHYVSNGAFRLVSWRLGDHIEVRRNPGFFDAAQVCPDRINYYPTPDAVAAERRVGQSELDLNANFQSNRIARIRRDLPGYARPYRALATSYLSFNTRDVAPLKDARVRKALSEAIDRDFITAKLLRAGQQPAYSFVPPWIGGYVPGVYADFAGLSYAQRQGEARTLLARAGFSAAHPLELEIKVSSTSDSLLISQAIQADWQAVGVKARVVQNEGQVVSAAYRNRDFQVGVMSWYADYNDAATFLGVLRSTTGAQNYGDYRNPAYDAALDAAEAEADMAKRAQILARAEQAMLDQAAMAPLYFIVNRNLVNPRVSGFTDNAPNFHRARWLCLKDAAP
jgi:oligopeptide transport system substrate-binding protein